MNRALSIQLKAGFLVLVFSLNTLAGFACSIGLDMGFNSSHHHEEEAAEVHIHQNGKIHHHEMQSPAHTGEHKGKKHSCCSDEVTWLSLGDKAVPQTGNKCNPVSFITITPSHYLLDITYSSQVTGSTRYFTRSYHPPIPDIRIAIRSFQI